jgi:hypothetical protein
VLAPLPVANALLVFASTLFAMALTTRSAFYVVWALVALLLAGQLVGAASKAVR